MSTTIGNVRIENPTKTWTQLMNVRHNVLAEADRWNNGTWFEGDRNVNTMCLANAVRFVIRGNAKTPENMAHVSDNHDAERLLLWAINDISMVGRYDAIPSYNDAGGRNHKHILEALDHAIKALAPHAKVYAITIAADVMTDEEKAEVNAGVRKAEDEIWAERWPNVERSTAMLEFRAWLNDHQKRGWGTFWDELADCKGDEDCEKRMEAALA
jgi:hypothetical protein